MIPHPNQYKILAIPYKKPKLLVIENPSEL